MNKAGSQNVILLLVSVILFVVCIVASQLILPENCYLYEWRQVGLLCDAIDFEKLQPCTACSNESVARIARILFVSGVCLLILPFVVLVIKERRSHPVKPPKILD